MKVKEPRISSILNIPNISDIPKYKIIVLGILIFFISISILILHDNQSNNKNIIAQNNINNYTKEDIKIEESNIQDTSNVRNENKTQPAVSEQCDVSRTQITRGNVERKSVPSIDTSMKTYMPYTSVTNKSSTQWEYRQLAYTDDNGFRKIDNDYVVALGTYYANTCGERFEITLDSGNVFTAITGDIKQDAHTDSTNRYIPKNGNVVEFLVDTNKIDSLSKKMGDISYSGFEGDIISIVKLT